MSEQPGRIGQESSNQKSDPTALTTDQLQREIAQQYQLMMSELKTINQSIQDQKELRNAQLQGIQQQLAHAESLRKELKEDNEKNIDKALTGVEKATDKLEANITRLFAQLGATGKADIEGLRRDIDSLKDRINDNKERVGGLESQRTGIAEGRMAMSDGLKLGISIIGAVILLIGFFLAQRGGP